MIPPRSNGLEATADIRCHDTLKPDGTLKSHWKTHEIRLLQIGFRYLSYDFITNAFQNQMAKKENPRIVP